MKHSSKVNNFSFTPFSLSRLKIFQSHLVMQSSAGVGDGSNGGHHWGMVVVGGILFSLAVLAGSILFSTIQLEVTLAVVADQGPR